jgi:ABC-type multidrug transport system fused ATPase/permease subunit
MIRLLFNLFVRGEQRKILFITIIQILTGLLDLVGLAIIGLIATMSSQILAGKSISPPFIQILKYLQIYQFTFYQQIILLSFFSLIILTFRTLLSIFMTEKIFRLFGIKSSELTSKLLEKIFSEPVNLLNSKNVSEMTFVITKGVDSIAMGVVATSIVVLADLSILVLLILALLIYEPLVAGTMLILLGTTTYFLLKFLRASASRYSTDATNLENEANQRIGEILQLYKVLVPRYSYSYLIKSIEVLRRDYSKKQSRIELLPYASKYVIEITILAGAMLIGFLAVTYYDSRSALMMTVIFLASGSRIAPALLRFQQGVLLVRSSFSRGRATLELFNDFDVRHELFVGSPKFDNKHLNFVGSIEISDLKYRFPGSENNFIDGINLSISPGLKVAIIGPSGAGKTTLLDLILGLLQPNSGKVLISESNPRVAMKTWPGAIAYIPQETFLTQDSILANISMGYPIDSNSLSLASESLDAAQLNELHSKLNSVVFDGPTEKGLNLSGGEKQRLGIARALFSKPKVILLDEATSSLDVQTEKKVLAMIDHGLLREVTLITVTHNISTVLNSDIVVYLNQGKVIAIGTYEEVASKVKNLVQHANLNPF